VIRALVTDIEGTTSCAGVLKDLLAPYARAHLRPYVAAHRGEREVEDALAAARALGELSDALPDADEAETVALLERWIDEDVKAPPLKTLQGLVWERGYRDGTLRAHLYPDVVPTLRALRARGLALYVYSSGSVRAQQLFFEHSIEGDVRALFDGYFDTSTGPKHDARSYTAIARALGVRPESVLFLSDAQAELDAAREAGLAVLGVTREGNAPIVGHRVVSGFQEIAIDAARSGAQDEVPSALAAQIVALARVFHGRGLMLATSGNLSARIDAEQVAITASGRDKGALASNDVVAVDLAARPLAQGVLPSAETALHCALYRADRAIGAVAHTHSVAATVLSRRHLARGVLRIDGYEMRKALPGPRSHEAPIVLPIVPNSQDMDVLGAALSEALAAHPEAPGYLVAGHGLTTWAPDLQGLARHVEALEFLLECALWDERAP